MEIMNNTQDFTPAEPGLLSAKQAAVWFLVLCLGSQYLLIAGVYLEWIPRKIYTFRIFGPLVAAVIASYSYAGKAGVREIFASLFTWRCHWRWYVFCFVWLTLFSFALLVLENLVMGRGFAPIPLDFSNVSPFSADPSVAHVSRSILRGSIFIAFVEEIAWVSCFMMLLHRYFTPLVASIITSVFWCSWWVPAILLGDGVIAGLPIPVLYVHYVGLAATCLWVYHFTKSAILVIAMQFITNMVSLIIPVLPDSGGMGTYLVYVFSKCLLIFVLFAKFGPKPLWRKSPAASAFPTNAASNAALNSVPS